MSETSWLDVEVEGERVDVVARDGVVASIRPAARRRDGGGAALLPGLHDQHLHLFAAAAAHDSVQLGDVDWRAALAGADRRLPTGAWIRAVGHDETFDGPLDRVKLDEVVADRPVRVQHRTGMLWVLNGRALAELGLDHPTGRLLRADELLRGRTGADVPDVESLARDMASRGVTEVTDTTPYRTVDELARLADVVGGAFPLLVRATGGPELCAAEFPSALRRGPVKVVLDEADLPDLAEFEGWITESHRVGRPVAVHAVTRSTTAFAVAGWRATGAMAGDRVEHGSVVPPDLADALALLGVAVVTQPSLVHLRGDRYLAEVDPDDVRHLWPCGSLLRRGVRVAAGSDAPYGALDPWESIAAAIDRRTRAGAVLGVEERVDAATALGLWLQDTDGRRRRVAVGAPADLCLLDRPLAAALASPRGVAVTGTWRSGRRIH